MQEVREESVLEAESTGADSTSQEHAAMSESTDQMPSEELEAAPTGTSPASADQQQAAMSETTDQVQTSSSSPPPGTSLYIGNLFFEVTEEQLQEEFGRHGTVNSVKIVRDNLGQSKGFGFVEMASKESADEALHELHDKIFLGRRLAVQPSVRKPREDRDSRGGRDGTPSRGSFNSMKRTNPPSKTLFIGNMSYQMSDRDLNDLFRDIKNVIDVRVAIDRRSGQPRGFAHADFTDIESAEAASKVLSTKYVYGRQLRVDFSSATAGGN